MHLRLRYLSLAVTALLFAMTSPLFPLTSHLTPLQAQAQTAQGRKVEALRLNQEGLEQGSISRSPRTTTRTGSAATHDQQFTRNRE